MRKDEARGEFERFVTDSAAGLLRTAYLVARDLTVAEDLVQECLFRVARRWPRVRSMEYPSAYARRILINLALDGAEGRYRDSSELASVNGGSIDDYHDESAARSLVEVDTTSELIEALGELAPRQRAALVLRYFEDLSEAQAAEAMGCSVGTIKSTTSRALERLRQIMGSRAEDRVIDPNCATNL